MTTDFDFARRQLIVNFAFQAIGHGAFDQDDAFGADTSGFVDQIGIGFGRTDDDLGQSVTVAQVDKDGSTVVTFAFHPAAEGNFRANVFFAELAAGMRT